jgi:hypothetical protein
MPRNKQGLDGWTSLLLDASLQARRDFLLGTDFVLDLLCSFGLLFSYFSPKTDVFLLPTSMFLSKMVCFRCGHNGA